MTAASFPRLLVRNWRIKAAALALAALLWVTMRLRDDEPISLDIHGVAVQVSESMDAGWVLAGPPSPSSVRLTVTGAHADLFRVGAGRPVVVVPADSVPGEDWLAELNPDWVRNIDRTRVAVGDIVPSTVRLRFERNVSEWIPVSVRHAGAPPAGASLSADPTVSPVLVRVRGPASVVDTLQAVFTETVDLGAVEGPEQLAVALDVAGLAEAAGVAVVPDSATVTILAGPTEQRALGSLAVELPDSAMTAEPSAVAVTLRGTADALAAIDPASLRVRVSLDPAVLRAQAERGPARVPVVISGLPRWVDAEADADSVTVRRARAS